MSTKFAAIALGGMLALGTTAALFAQDNSAPDNSPPAASAQPPAQFHRARHMDPDRQLAHLTRRLNLTADQQNQIRPILVARQQKVQAVFHNQSLSPQDRRAQMHSIQQDSRNQIEAVLNDQQKQQFEAMQQRMREHWRQMHAGDNQPPTSSPQPQ